MSYMRFVIKTICYSMLYTPLQILGTLAHLPRQNFITTVPKHNSKLFYHKEKDNKAVDQTQLSNTRINTPVNANVDDMKTKTQYLTPQNDTKPATLKRVCSHLRCKANIRNKRPFSIAHRLTTEIKNHVGRILKPKKQVSMIHHVQVI